MIEPVRPIAGASVNPDRTSGRHVQDDLGLAVLVHPVGVVRILSREQELVATAVQTDRYRVFEEQPSAQRALGVRFMR
ncbi:hypothetical protein OHS32_09740 [Micromonospora chokoriensis]